MTKILVIEDEVQVRENIQEILELEDFDILVAENGRIGVQLAKAEIPDLIICDIMMPELDGYGVLTALRQDWATATIPLIFLTAKADRSDMRQGMQLGADDYLIKPVTPAELLQAIATRLERQAAIIERYTNMKLGSSKRLALEVSLRHALEREEFQVYYQPRVDLQTGEIISAEALLRWNHPERGLVLPAEFIPIAEETGLIIPIGEWVLRTACVQAKAWQVAHLAPIQVAVNLSARQLIQNNLTKKIFQILTEKNLEHNFLELEITESLLMQDAENASKTLRELRSIGVSISIDDFGAGYSSLNYLHKFQFDTLKIDRSFIRNIANNPENAVITKAMIQMAHGLNLKVIAEGVETEAELAFLCQQQCNAIQGYLFSRPVPAAEFEMLLTAGKQLRIPTSTARGRPLYCASD